MAIGLAPFNDRQGSERVLPSRRKSDTQYDPTALAPLISDGPIILLTLLVLSQMPLWLEQALQTAGGCFSFLSCVRDVQDVARIQSSQHRSSALNHNGRSESGHGERVESESLPELDASPGAAPREGMARIIGTWDRLDAGIILLSAGARNLGPSLNRGLLGISALGLALCGLFQLWQGTIARWWVGSV
jgi:hypothetical protein